jgi:hypothetical protein
MITVVIVRRSARRRDAINRVSTQKIPFRPLKRGFRHSILAQKNCAHIFASLINNNKNQVKSC